MDYFRVCMIREFYTWKKSNMRAVISNLNEFTYGDLYKMVCYNAQKIRGHGEIFVLCNENKVSFIVDLVAIMLTGNIPLIMPSYLYEEDINKNKIAYNALPYKNSDIKELLSIIEDNYEYGYVPKENSIKLALIMYSSGTTEMGKMIPISYKSLYYRILYTEKYFKRIEKQEELIIAPIFSALGLQHQLFPCLARRCTIVLYEGLMNPRKIVALVNKYQIKYLSMVPTVLKCIYEYCLGKKEMLFSVQKIFVCGEKSDSNFLKEILEYFKDAQLYQAYGMSEMLPISMQLYSKEEDIVENCVGKIIDEIEVKIIDQDKEGFGEICAAGYNMINGYYNEKEKFDWVKTGDIGYIDKDGFLYIIGRKKNMVIVNGNNIYIEVIERIAESYAGIDEAKAINMKDNLRGEVILLQLKLKENVVTELRTEELRSYINRYLHAGIVPIKIQVVDQIEHTYNLKKRR